MLYCIRQIQQKQYHKVTIKDYMRLDVIVGYCFMLWEKFRKTKNEILEKLSLEGEEIIKKEIKLIQSK